MVLVEVEYLILELLFLLDLQASYVNEGQKVDLLRDGKKLREGSRDEVRSEEEVGREGRREEWRSGGVEE